MLCGGGTGGHITPILAIAHEIKKNNPNAHIIYVGEHGGRFGHLVKNLTSIDEVKTVYAGKLRRYHNESWIIRILDVKTNLLNLRDLFYVLIGFFQSLSLLRQTKPDIIFLKGGFVGLPLGLAAAFKKKPYITHDSDSIPSLTNKIVGKWAVFNATGTESGLYSYPKHKMQFVGIPVGPEFEEITKAIKIRDRADINISENAKLLVITGGSLGAVRLNQSVVAIIERLFEQINDLYVVHQVGKGNTGIYKNFTHPHLKIEEFIANLYKYTGAADSVITRSGANTVAELAVQGKAIIIVPNPELTGGHQTKNAAQLASKDAAVVISEKELIENPDTLLVKVSDLLNNKVKQIKLGENLRKEAVPDSAYRIAMLLLSLVK